MWGPCHGNLGVKGPTMLHPQGTANWGDSLAICLTGANVGCCLLELLSYLADINNIQFLQTTRKYTITSDNVYMLYLGVESRYVCGAANCIES